MTEEVQAYISQADEAHRPELVEVYEVIRAVLPDEREWINWGMPTFGKNIIHFSAAKRHVGIYPGPEAVSEFSSVLDERGFKHSKGAIQFPYGRIDLQLIADIACWCRNHAGSGKD